MPTYFPTDSAPDTPVHADTPPTVQIELEDGFYWHRIRRMSKKA
jgi:hypothetical protein